MKLGILGGGQLAQMLAMAALPLGVRTVVLEPDAQAPARLVAKHLQASYQDSSLLEQVLEELAQCDAVTLEFENVPTEVLKFLENRVPVRPASRLFALSKNRILEKRALQDLGFRTAPFYELYGDQRDVDALQALGGEGIVKTAEFGYDGKGQRRVRSPAELLETPIEEKSILEGIVAFVCEVSLSVARSKTGEMAFSGLVENVHQHGILRRSIFPATSSPEVWERARHIASTAAQAWELEGLLTFEFFELPNGELLVNELAPRVHNSGHLTQDGGGISQFEAQVRAVLDLPLIDFVPHRPCAMINILGETPSNKTLQKILSFPGVRLHLYHKADRPGRKLGHINVVGESREEMENTVLQLEALLDKALL